MIIAIAKVDWDSITHEYKLDVDADRSCHVAVDKNGLVLMEARTKMGYKQPGMVLTRESAKALRDCLIAALDEPKRFSAWTMDIEGFPSKAEGITQALRNFINIRL